jgi:catechol 2,3-dioxygenase-like lactoylglutathione lyase family enzyme
MPDLAIDHVQIAIPPGGEDEGRRFFGDLLGLKEIAKPDALAGRGGCWFDLGASQIHLGVDPGFRPATRAHVALRVAAFAELRSRLGEAGFEIVEGEPLDGCARFFTLDPFGNRIEFMERAAGR